MRSPYSLPQLVLFIFAVVVLSALVQFGVLSIAFGKLGLSWSSAMLLLFASLFGSAFNLPLFSIRTEAPADDAALPPPLRGLLRQMVREYHGRTLIAVNVGGCLVPVWFSLYLLSRHALPAWQVLLSIAVVAAVSHRLSRPVRGIGIAMPVFVAPVCAALVALIVNPAEAAPLAYVCGTLGVLIGADLLRLRDIRRMGAPVASIGGAGTFDGIFVTGIVAVLLA